MSKPIAVSDIDVNNVKFVVGQAKAGRNPPISIKYNDQNLQIVLPRLSFPGGAIIRDNEQGGTTYTLMGTLKGCDPYATERSTGDDPVSKLYNFMLDLEERILKEAADNSVKWFGKKRSEVAIKEGFNRILGVSRDKIDGEYVPNGKYPPSMKIKIPVYNNRVEIEVVDSKRNPVYVTPESLGTVFSKGVEAGVSLSGSIYVMSGGGFGVTWRLQYSQVFPRSRITAADVFSATEDDSEEVEVPVAPAPAPAPSLDETHEEDDAPSEQPVAPAAPAGGRKRRTAAQ